MKHVEPVRGQSYETSGGPHEDILMIVDFSEKDWDYQEPILAAEWMPLHSKRRAAHHRTNMFCCLHSDFSFFFSLSLSLPHSLSMILGIIYIIIFIDTNGNMLFMLGIPMSFSLDFCGSLGELSAASSSFGEKWLPFVDSCDCPLASIESASPVDN